MPLFLEILIRKNGEEKWVDSRKFFDYMLKEYSKVNYSNKMPDPYNTRVSNFYSNIPEHIIKAWSEAYPNVNIKQECSNAKAWLLSNTSKAKKDFSRFTNNWLAKAMQNGGNMPVQVDRKIDKQIEKRNKYLKEAEVDSAPQDWVKDLLKQTKENMGKK